MRQVFTSARLENVEKVAQLLEDAGIETRVTQRRAYKSRIRGEFSYRDEPGEQKPAVWIVRSEDQIRARQMLRELGLMDSSRNAPDSYLSVGLRGGSPDPHEDAGRRRAFRVKIGLLVVIVAIMLLGFMAWRPSQRAGADANTEADAAISQPATSMQPVPEDLPGRGNTVTPDSLAVAMLRGELPTRAGDIACIAIDGFDPSPELLAALPPTPGKVLPMTQCPASVGSPGAPLLIGVGKYVANDAGTGTIFLQRRRAGGRAVPQWYQVRRDGDGDGDGWRIIQPL